MSRRLFIGNLPYDATEAELREHFSRVGAVSRVFIPLDRDTGKVRGFAFIEYEDPEKATVAIEQLHEQPFKERDLVVNEARPSEARPSPGGARPLSPGATGRTFSSRPRERTTVGETGEEPRRAPPKPRRRKFGRGGGSWEDGPKKAPIPVKRRAQFFGGDDDDEDGEEVDFENFATGLVESEDED